MKDLSVSTSLAFRADDATDEPSPEAWPQSFVAKNVLVAEAKPVASVVNGNLVITQMNLPGR
jgi:hypothetical protein